MADSKVQMLNIDANEIMEERVMRANDTTALSFVVRNQVSPAGTVTSGALPTQQLVTATGAAISVGGGATRDVETHTTCATTSAAGTITAQISPDNVTYSTLCIYTPAVSLVTFDVIIRVPAGWFVKLTSSNATIGLTTVY